IVAITAAFRSAPPVAASASVSSDSAARIYANPMTFLTSHFMPLLNPPLELVVTSTDDPGDGVCDSVCTLREAMTDANVAPDVNTINFDIPGPGPYSIQPLTPLPLVSNPVIINGRSQNGYPGRPIIEIDGTNVFSPIGETKVGINITGGGTTVRGLA